MTRVLALVNAAAGSTAEEAVAAAMVALRAGADVELVPTADLDELAAAVATRGDRRLVLLGGDGSMHALAQVLHDAGDLHRVGPVGLVPLGTGNDLARSLGIPLDPAQAATVALTGRGLPVEMMLDSDDRVVVNAVHAGAGAEAAQRAASVKPVLGRAAYPAGAVAEGLRTRGWHLRVTVDDAVLHDGDERVLMVALGLGTSIGGGALVAPHANPFDGVADVMVSLATGPVARVGYALAMRRGKHGDRDDVVTARGCEVTVESVDSEPFHTNADGELAGPFTTRSWRVVTDAWQLVVPDVDPPRTGQAS